MDENTKLLRALLMQDWDTYNEMVADFERQGKGTPVAIIGAAFHLAVLKRFGDKRDVGDVIRFVAEARTFLSEGRDLPAKEAEAVIFATLDLDLPGVEDVVDRLEVGEIAEIEGQLLFKLVTDERYTDQELDEFLLKAQALTEQWQGQ